jgi:hypothetical protein
MDRERFGRYLLRELLWELEQAGMQMPGLTDVDAEALEVVGFSRYDWVRVRVGSAVVEARLSWRGDVPPTLTPVSPELP